MSIYEPIKWVRRQSGIGMPSVQRIDEVASLEIQEGTPLKLASGLAGALDDPPTVAVLGIANEPSHNLDTSATAQDGQSEASPINQPNASIVPVGAWLRDGKIGVYIAEEDAVFSVMLFLGQVWAASMLGTRFDMNKDATTGLWYIDNTDSGTAAEHVAEVVQLDPDSPGSATLGERVFIKFPQEVRVFG